LILFGDKNDDDDFKEYVNYHQKDMNLKPQGFMRQSSIAIMP